MSELPTSMGRVFDFDDDDKPATVVPGALASPHGFADMDECADAAERTHDSQAGEHTPGGWLKRLGVQFGEEGQRG